MQNSNPTLTAYQPNLIHCDLSQYQPESITKVLILGAESTGKTTLCQDLATHFNEPWVLEYMRPYLQEKWDKEQKTCEWQDLLPIAQGQIDLENKLAKQAQKYLFCDTSLFELMVYSHWYYNDCPSQIEQAVLSHHYDLILLTKVDVPWVADDLRDCPHERDKMAQKFADTLRHYNKDFRWIGGSRQQRVQTVVGWLNDLLA
ncbi:AAA family ATPase [Psychrobacter sp. I-STPA6b]|uniref:AAA family ATPase n=1 Tax=Psychrobacter sp. I-STPA6b TaxID=2585718 RepID=UPI001D0CD007|nr:ATP-binding protein [Psychrobacter sp. I-STPA6b]